ncbi:MAG TPA: tRNA (adenosine(37)-N6)-threonylcarbamoyltransferase complex dimerization subunit type 1 TsaB [Steroidobacteraceae bacterium]|jgi:tRNA threonylcarbamoyladenosine biosynthesis protein TsaB|nr:tRNA (adenosine(37)-N6)-threonylcarbamoyltransferase complex dimerization subunit type 1 TsaB [Steroidobacteraceae bacterium]
MRILAVDTATEGCSVALLSGDEVIGRFAERGLAHAPDVLGMADAVLAEAGVALSALDGIAASIGPGAFTGVRISVAVVQGLAFGAGLRVVPITTLEALAYQAVQRGAARVLASLDARMGEVYWGCFEADTEHGLIASSAARVGPPESVVLPDLRVYRGIGRGFGAYPVLGALPGVELRYEDSRELPNAREFARLGALRLGLGEGIDPADLTPLYLRDKVALTEVERRPPKAQ